MLGNKKECTTSEKYAMQLVDETNVITATVSTNKTQLKSWTTKIRTISHKKNLGQPLVNNIPVVNDETH